MTEQEAYLLEELQKIKDSLDADDRNICIILQAQLSGSVQLLSYRSECFYLGLICHSVDHIANSKKFSEVARNYVERSQGVEKP